MSSSAEASTADPKQAGPSRLRFGALVAVIGILTGLGAAVLTWILHGVEELVYGHGEEHGTVLTDGVNHVRMSLGVLGVAIVLAFAWWLLRGKGRPLIGVEKTASSGKHGPWPETWANGIFQMVGVGAGLPVGREVAPREVASLMASQLSHRVRLDAADTSLLVAAAAGGGLGAVYQVPLAGAVYALELMIGEVSVRTVATCLATSTIAVITSRVVVSPIPQYATVPLSGSDWHLLVWAVVVGALLGIPGRWFGDVADHVKAMSQRGNPTLITLPAAGLLTAVMAYWFPTVLGNGRNAAQSAFLGIGLGVAVIVLVGKCLATFLTLRAGAVGGTLAPAIAAGALAGVIVARVAQLALPAGAVPLRAIAVLGAAAVLATSLRAPASGLLLVFGITGQPHEALVPMALCVAVAWGVSRLGPGLAIGHERREKKRKVIPPASTPQMER